ncbi:MAG: hypothetical protein HYT87_16210 [Nitrospirae bacterium]|nr:hypothetical protein [Nitrospirota bacterium]
MLTWDRRTCRVMRPSGPRNKDASTAVSPDRRSFLLAVGQAMLLPLVGACAKRSEDEPNVFFGSCQKPTNHEEETLLALADTVIPSAKEDPRGLPGAAEVCPLEQLYDPMLPLAAAAPLIVTFLDDQAKKKYGAEYKTLGLEERTEVTKSIEATLPLLGYLFKFIRGVYYTSPVAYAALGFPGNNLGYINHPDFSLREPLGEEMTPDGNMP